MTWRVTLREFKFLKIPYTRFLSESLGFILVILVLIFIEVEIPSQLECLLKLLRLHHLLVSLPTQPQSRHRILAAQSRHQYLLLVFPQVNQLGNPLMHHLCSPLANHQHIRQANQRCNHQINRHLNLLQIQQCNRQVHPLGNLLDNLARTHRLALHPDLLHNQLDLPSDHLQFQLHSHLTPDGILIIELHGRVQVLPRSRLYPETLIAPHQIQVAPLQVNQQALLHQIPQVYQAFH